MNTITKWALRSLALWAVSKALQLANDSLKQRQKNRQLRARGARAAALPRTVPHGATRTRVEQDVEDAAASAAP